MAYYEETEGTEDKREKAKRQLQAIIGFWKVTSFAELVDRLVYFAAALVGLGLIILIGAMISWLALLGLIATALVIWTIQLAWLWIVK